MDMDTQYGDVAGSLGIEARSTVVDLALRANDLDQRFLDRALVTHESGARVLAAPTVADWTQVTAEQVARVVEVASENADLVILDTPGTFNDLVATALVAADSVLAISSLGMASVRHTAEMLELLEIEGHPRDRLRLVLNQITPATPMLPQDVAAIVNHPVFWTIPYSAQVPESTANGRPIVLSNPKTDTAKQLRGLAEQLTGVAVPQRDLRALLRPGHLLRRSA
jgi:pilus assembly protein CpaE